MGELEGKLMLKPKLELAGSEAKDGGSDGVEAGEDYDSFDDYSGADDEDEEDSLVPLKRLRRRMEQCVLIRQLAESLGEDHPFVAAREERREKLRKTLLLDMGNAMKRVVETDEKGGEQELYMLKTYEMMGAPEECVMALKQARAGHEKVKGKGR